MLRGLSLLSYLHSAKCFNIKKPCFSLRYFSNFRKNIVSKSGNIKISRNVQKKTAFEILRAPVLFTLTTGVISFSCAIIYDLKFRKSSYFVRLYGNSNFLLNSDESLVFLLILGVNLLGFFLWKVAPQKPFMKYMLCGPFSKYPSASLVFSIFSHQSFLHLFCNMAVLHSFASVAQARMGDAQFSAFYLTAGMCAGLFSYLHRIAGRSKVMSLGASGALCAVMAYTACDIPNARFTILIVGPILGLDFSAQSGLYCMLALEVTCLLLGFRLFDHAAHLGGMLCGIAYHKYGNVLWEKRRHLRRFVES